MYVLYIITEIVYDNESTSEHHRSMMMMIGMPIFYNTRAKFKLRNRL